MGCRCARTPMHWPMPLGPRCAMWLSTNGSGKVGLWTNQGETEAEMAGRVDASGHVLRVFQTQPRPRPCQWSRIRVRSRGLRRVGPPFGFGACWRTLCTCMWHSCISRWSSCCFHACAAVCRTSWVLELESRARLRLFRCLLLMSDVLLGSPYFPCSLMLMCICNFQLTLTLGLQEYSCKLAFVRGHVQLHCMCCVCALCAQTMHWIRG